MKQIHKVLQKDLDIWNYGCTNTGIGSVLCLCT